MLFDMQDRPEPSQTLRFGRFELQPHQRRLLADGQMAALGARAFDLLVTLVSRDGQLVTKGELLNEVWPGLVVEEANLSVQVSTLRKVLGGDLITTIPGRGYRFTGHVEVVSANASAPPSMLSASGASAAARSDAAPATATLSAASAAPALIGRDDELAALQQTLSTAGCVTLVGPAGVGKTTLARALAAHRPTGAVWVNLAPLTAGDQVIAAVARALGTDSTEADRAERLRAKLGARMLVLDNVEHVIDACAALVSQWCQADAHLSVLATSQLPLAVTGERVHRLGPLALPVDSDALDLHCGAVALFVERARSADHRFQVTLEKLPLLREICRRLDGLPLALEMAAARVPVLGLRGLAQALERRLALLTGGRRDAAARHRTLQAALDWSHDLLSPDAQRLYRLCGVFTGGFSLELLVAVTVGQDGRVPIDARDERRWALIDTLSQLVDRSLVAAGTGEAPRYWLLETMREDALQRLRATGEDEDVRGRLLNALAGIAHHYLLPVPPTTGLDEVLRAEHDNLREAIAWGRRQTAVDWQAATLTLATATAQAATFSAWRLEALQWLESLEPLAEGDAIPAPPRVQWWAERARQSLMSRSDSARGQAERALALAREAGDDSAAFGALSTLVRAAGEQGEALSGLVQAMSELVQRHPEWGLRRAMTLAGAEAVVCDRLGDLEGMLRCRLRELELARRLGSETAATAVETNIVFALQSLGRHEEALLRASELTARLGRSDTGNAAYAWLGLVVSLQALRRGGEFRAAMPQAARVLRKHGLPQLGPQCALVLAAEGRMMEALRVLSHARACFAARGMRMTDEEREDLAALERQARAALGDAAVELCLAEGATLDEAGVDAVMLGTRNPQAPAGTAPALAPPR
jgi:non-specific serine/threonine protein kinase